MSKLKMFRAANNLQQKDIAEYLHVAKSFISQVESGKSPLPGPKLTELINNDRGWDTAILTDPDGNTFKINTIGPTEIYNKSSKITRPSSAEVELLKVQIKILQEQLESEKERANRYWAMIEKLTTK